MSAYKYVTVECDHTNGVLDMNRHRICFDELHTDASDIPTARREARLRGWTHRQGQDLCPVHSGHATAGHELSDGSMHYDWLPEHVHFEEDVAK